MAVGNTATPTPPMEPSTSPPMTNEEAAARAVQKRYEGLALVRNKAVKGKGAWYWAHLEPLLVHHGDTGLPKAVKLKCRLCDAVFSASNPSRTASEHLKRGTCPNFSISSLPPASADSSTPNHRKRTSSTAAALASAEPSPSSYHASPLTMIDPSRYCNDVVGFSHSTAIVVASGNGDHHSNLSPLAVFEDSVKRLKSPKTSPGPAGRALTKSQIEFALDCLADWVYESGGGVSLSALEHPKFKSFLTQVGLPAVSRFDLSGPKLDSKYEASKAEADARIRDALFFQVSSDGWKWSSTNEEEDHLINLSVNLPNGTSVFRRAVLTGCARVPSDFAREVLWESISEICGSNVSQCVGIVGDRFKNKALRELEIQHPWMVNLSCQCQGFIGLIKDFYKELPLFMNVADSCRKVANFVNNKTQVRCSFKKIQLQECGCSDLLKVNDRVMSFESVFAMVEDVIGSARALQGCLLDESLSIEDPVVVREFGEMVRDVGFWNDLEAVRSLVGLIKEMAHDMETERPLVGQCLPLWEELRAKVKGWCANFRISEGAVEKIFERRMKKNYHPAWAAAYILDPLYLIRDASGKYLPPFKHLTPQQEKDVVKLITQLVPREEAHIALMELMKWRTEGLDPVYAQAVQLKQRDPNTGKMKIANPQSSRLVWETYLTEFKSLRKVAVRLIFLHATSSGFKCNLSLLRWVQGLGRSRAGMDKAQKMIFIAAHSKLKKRDLSSEDNELFGAAPAPANGESHGHCSLLNLNSWTSAKFEDG